MRVFLSLALAIYSALLAFPVAALEKLDASIADEITVLADPSLSVPLVRLARRYGELYNVAVSTSFGSSKDQVAQIKDGEQGNVFITAKPAWMKLMQQEGLIDVYSRTTIARNRLAIVAPLARKTQVGSLTELALLMASDKHDALFALGDPEYMAEGTYTLGTLSHYKISGDFEPHLSILKNSYQLKNTIANYDAYGAIFLTDALLYPDIARIETVDESAHEAITYQAAVIVGNQMDQAAHFVNYMKNAEAQSIFKEYGFGGAY